MRYHLLAVYRLWVGEWTTLSDCLLACFFLPFILPYFSCLLLSCLVLIPGSPGLALLTFLAYCSSRSSNFSNPYVCNSAVFYRIYWALWACSNLSRHFVENGPVIVWVGNRNQNLVLFLIVSWPQLKGCNGSSAFHLHLTLSIEKCSDYLRECHYLKSLS